MGDFMHVNVGGSGECGYLAILAALAIAGGTCLEEVRSPVVDGAVDFIAKITLTIRKQRLFCNSFALDLAWAEHTEGGLVPTSYDKWVTAAARQRRWIE